MGTYKFYKLSISKWAERTSGQRNDCEYWENIFKQHPEFFLLEGEERASLVWRRTNQKLYDVDAERQLSKEEYAQLKEGQQSRISRKPLSPDDIGTLINTAIELHSRATEQERERRWWVPVAIGLVGVLVGALAKGA